MGPQPNSRLCSAVWGALQRTIPLWGALQGTMPALPTGRMVTYLNSDEEKLLVDITKLRDFYGFGLDRDDIMATAQR